MSVHARKRARGKIRDLRDRGRHEAIDAGSESLREAAERWWVDHVESSVGQRTAMVYASALDGHLLPRLGSMAIRDIQPADVVALQRDLRADGVGEAMTQKTLMVLSGIMRHGQLLGRIPANPVGPVRIRLPKRKRAIRPLAPETVEAMRSVALARGWLREATLLSLLAYAGLRPGEAFALRWDGVGDRSLIIEHGRADGLLKATKTDRIRTVGLLRVVTEDLGAWRAVARAGGERDLLFQRTDRDVFRDTDYHNWRDRRFDPLARAAGADDATPYTLR